jgi:hypothetical protein
MTRTWHKRERLIMRLLDPRFKYIPAAHTDVAATWRRFGFRPTTEAERRSRKLRDDTAMPEDSPRTNARERRRRRRPNLTLAVNE